MQKPHRNNKNKVKLPQIILNRHYIYEYTIFNRLLQYSIQRNVIVSIFNKDFLSISIQSSLFSCIFMKLSQLSSLKDGTFYIIFQYIKLF